MLEDSSKYPTPEGTTASNDDHARSGYGPLSALLISITAFFGAQIIVGFLISPLPILFGWSTEQFNTVLKSSVFARFLTILVVELLMLWFVWSFMKARQIGLKAIGLVKPQARDVSFAILGYGMYFFSFIALSIIARALFHELDFAQEQQIGFSRSTVGSALWLVFASLVILPPIAEEILFRGFLYTGLRTKWPKVLAATLTSLLFAAAHLQWGSGQALLWVAALDTFVLSIILIYLREKTDSLWAPILVHMIKNGFAFTLIFVFRL